MKYIEVKFSLPSQEIFIKDILSAQLGEIGFESFVDSESALLGYIPENKYKKECIEELITQFEFAQDISFSTQEMEDKNWNEEWEKNFFQPLIIGDQCVIHSSFHKDYPAARYDILIDPKMAFGTGHHETTSLMIESLLECDVKKKKVLDMGCGTAILSILSSKLDASEILGIDIDEWAYNNAIENVAINNAENIRLELGGAERLLANLRFDIILANINKNILLNDINKYVTTLNDGGVMFLSGFYDSDLNDICKECEKYNLSYVSHKTKKNWVAVKFKK
jgi:ribosomal protein L11 methyltransferase